MSTCHHRFIAATIALGCSILAFGQGVATSHAESVSRATAHRPRITFVDEPTQQARDIVDWAVDRFTAAGLQLPDLKISFPKLCDRKGALYHVGKKWVEFCRINKRRALHEFAHAWDDTSGAVDRTAFLKLRGLNVWWGGTEMRSSEQGAEHLAEIISWGLAGADPTDVPQLPKNSLPELTKAFALLTGKCPINVSQPAVGGAQHSKTGRLTPSCAAVLR